MRQRSRLPCVLLAAALVVLAAPAPAQTAYLGIEPADPAPGDEVIASVWRPAGGYDPVVVPRLYVGFAFTSSGPFTPFLAPLSPQPYDAAAANYFRVSLGRVSRMWINVRYYHAAEPDFSRPPDAVATFEVKERPVAYVDVIEYYNAARDHYFMTADEGEVARLDGGQTPGWRRTGASFKAYRANRAPSGLGSPVCRFYGRPEYGLDSHFYSAWPAECADVERRWPLQWQLEASDVFEFVYYYSCGDDAPTSRPLYRLFNNRPDVNHRYVTSLALRDQMVADGWVPEGAGPDAVAGCVFP